MINRKLNRREFVQGAAASAFCFTYLPRRVWGANERLHVAGIGVGGKGASDVGWTDGDNPTGAAAEGCNIVALCDADEKRAARTVKKHPKAKFYHDFRVMLDKQKDIDAVTVSTPDHTHAVAAVRAMKMGKHCYCQKPLTHSIYEARVMAETAANCCVATQMGNQAHAGEPIRRAVEVVRAGIIGKVREAHIQTNRPIWPQGVNRSADKPPVPEGLDWDLWLGPAPERPYHPDYVPFKWRGWWDFGTGALGDMACHIMDMAYWALDLKYPTSVEAVHEGGTKESPPKWSIITYEFPGCGEQPPVKLVWYDGGKLPPDDIVEGENAKSIGTILVGEKGKMYFNRSRTNWVVKPKSIIEDFEPPPKSIPRTKNEDFEWVQACKGGPAALSNFAVSGPFSEVVLLGNLAIRAGKKIEWNGEQMCSPNAPEVEQYVRREYRKGWTL